MDAAFNLEGYTTEVTVPENSPAAGMTVKALEDLGENEIEVITLLRRPTAALRAGGQCAIKPGDILILQGEPAALERIVALEKLELTRDEQEPRDRYADRRDRRDGGGDHAGLRARRQLCRAAQAVRPPRRQSARGEPQGAAHRASPALGQAQGRRRHRAAGAISPRCRRRSASCTACRSPNAIFASGRQREPASDRRPRRRHGAGRLQRRAGGGRVFRRRGDPAVRPLALACARPTTPSNGRSWSCSAR